MFLYLAEPKPIVGFGSVFHIVYMVLIWISKLEDGKFCSSSYQFCPVSFHLPRKHLYCVLRAHLANMAISPVGIFPVGMEYFENRDGRVCFRNTQFISILDLQIFSFGAFCDIIKN